MKEKVEYVPAASLVFDTTFYPRHVVDEQTVREYKQSLQAGEELPPLLADRKTRTLVDGKHRLDAYVGVQGLETQVPVIFRDYADEKAMFIEAVEINSRHGRRLTPFDKTRCFVLAEHFGITRTVIAQILSVTEGKLQKIEVRRIARDEQGNPVPVKEPLQSFAQQEMTPMQIEIQRHIGGMSLTYCINQIALFLESDMPDLYKPETIVKLQRWHDAIDKFIAQTEKQLDVAA